MPVATTSTAADRTLRPPRPTATTATALAGTMRSVDRRSRTVLRGVTKIAVAAPDALGTLTAVRGDPTAPMDWSPTKRS